MFTASGQMPSGIFFPPLTTTFSCVVACFDQMGPIDRKNRGKMRALFFHFFIFSSPMFVLFHFISKEKSGTLMTKWAQLRVDSEKKRGRMNGRQYVEERAICREPPEFISACKRCNIRKKMYHKLENLCQVDFDRAEKLARKLGVSLYEVSAKTGTHLSREQ